MGTKLVSISIAVTLAVFAVSWLGDQTGSFLPVVMAHRTALLSLTLTTKPSLYGLPLMAAMALGVFIVQWIGLIHARLFETEHYFDLVGSLTYITVTILAVQQAADFGLRQQLIAGAVIVWAARLALSCLCGRLRIGIESGRRPPLQEDQTVYTTLPTHVDTTRYMGLHYCGRSISGHHDAQCESAW